MMYAFKFTASAWLASVVITAVLFWWIEAPFTVARYVEVYTAGGIFAFAVIFPAVWWSRR